MRTIFILLLLFLVSFCFAQRPVYSLNVSDSFYSVLAGAISPNWDTAHNQNNWAWIQTNAHGKIHFLDTITQTITGLTLYFDTTYGKVVSVLIVEDETTSRMSGTTAFSQGKAGAQYYGNGSYNIGASVLQDRANVTITSMHSLDFHVYYNGGWVIEDAPYNAVSLSVSQPPTLAYSAGRLRFTNFVFNIRGFPQATAYALNGIDSLIGYQPAIDNIDNVFFDLYWWDSKNNKKLTAATPPPFLGAYISLGEVFTLCNPIAEDMGFSANFWVYAIMKR